MAIKTRQLVVRINDTTKNWLVSKANCLGISVSEYVRSIIIKELEKHDETTL